jgi:hypothetical protein
MTTIEPPDREPSWGATEHFAITATINPLTATVALAGEGNSAQTDVRLAFEAHSHLRVRGEHSQTGFFDHDGIELLRLTTYGESERRALAEAFRRIADILEQ